MRRLPGFFLVMLAAAEVSAQLPAADHAAKRQRVLDALTADGIIFVEGTGTKPRSDQAYLQSQNFQALTGLIQPGSALVLWKKGTTTGQRVIVPPKPAYAWEGEQIGPEEASRMMGIPAIPSSALAAFLDSLGARTSKVYLIGQDAGWPGLSTQLTRALGDSGVIRGGGRGGGGRAAGGGRGAGGAAPAVAPAPPLNDMQAITTAMSRARARFLSWKRTSISPAPSTTCCAVRIYPAPLMTKPEPRLLFGLCGPLSLSGLAFWLARI